MQFITPIHIPNAPFQIKHSDKVFMIGSCFADNIACLLKEGGMQVCNNPFGTLYNPISIGACLERLSLQKYFTEDDLLEVSGMYHSMMHHGSFSSSNKSLALDAINKSLETGYKALKEADVIVVTFGTAWVYEFQGQIVANCHKIPEDKFIRRRLAPDEIVEQWKRLTNSSLIAGKKLIFTVSPIRHIKDGLHENQLSKATLLLAIDQLTQGNVTYFPSYEILMDELRDYRYYAEDMLHPSSQAIRYIYEIFLKTYFSQQEQSAISECRNFHKLKQHKPLHPDSAEYTIFQEKLKQTERSLKLKYPYF